MKLRDQVAIVTGSSSGIGKEITRLFLQEGAKVMAADLNEEGCLRLQDEVGEELAKNLLFLATDVSKKEQVEQLIAKTTEKFGQLDILVNNAGVMDDMVPVGDLTDELWEKVMRINVDGVMYACRLAIPLMENRNGKIINISSVGGLFGNKAGAAHTASKHAVIGLSKNIGFMYARSGLRCNVIAPGATQTNIQETMKNVHEFGVGRTKTDAASVPRVGEAKEVANVALFLASDDSSMINGSVIVADAGWTVG
ncbi:SDR family oxidoreductase [Enterococcus timonensis]|uniref:SDR family oxidoreductase n=1 Tax=Enterococcus timonensis TaxID=1852364 RepID=UPI0008D98D20|nr:SDR family oxidoreductase [Enterococcus timonensis]